MQNVLELVVDASKRSAGPLSTPETMSLLKTTQPTPKPDTALNCALSRWENEGGAISAQNMDDSSCRSGLADEKEAVLLRLGAGVVACCTDLPNEIQRELFRTATSEDCQPILTTLKRQIARFLHLYANGYQSVD